MKNGQRYILLAAAAVLCGVGWLHAAGAEEELSVREYRIKGAYLYNFFSFIDWPEEKSEPEDESVTIGIVCENPQKEFKAAFEPLTQKKVQGKPVKLVFFNNINPIVRPNEKNRAERNTLIEAMKKCHIIKICGDQDSTSKNVPAVLNALKGNPVLTVAESPGFIEKGGNINFVTVDDKISFEINLDTAIENKLTIRSKLLKLAKRVIK